MERLDLLPLPDAEVGALVRGLAASSGGIAESTVADVVARAEGNAFYAEELLAAGQHGEALPLGLTDVLLARVEQRAPAAQQVVRIAAVAGRRVRHELVAAVGGLGPVELDDALAELVHSHLLVVSDDRALPVPARAAARGRPGRPAARRAGASARGHRRLSPRTPGAGTAAERAHHARGEGGASGCLRRVARGCRRRGPGRCAGGAVAAPRGRARALVRRAGCREAGRTDQAALVLETAGAARAVGEVHGPWRSSGRPSSCSVRTPTPPPGRASTTRSPRRWCASRTTAGAYHESSAAMTLVPADPPSKVRTWAAATHARMSYSLGLMDEGDAAAEEALAAADKLGLDSAWSDTAVSQVRARADVDPVVVQQRLDEALLPGTPVR